MERFTISQSEKQTIYEIYRACRICGAGGGYRMPIVQNIVDFDTSDVELRQKIQDCLQLEVRSDDRMPPLICELCVDKVNDFYAFLELSRQTNIRTRSRLGLPLQTAKKGESDAGDCILGVTEPIRESPAPKKSTAGPKCSKRNKKEPENVTVKVEPTVPSPAESRSSSVSSRSSRAGRRAPTPPRPARNPRTETPKATPVTQEKKRVNEKELQKTKEFNLRGLGKELQDLLQDNQKYVSDSLLGPRSMKRKEAEPPKPAIVPKRTRATPKEPIQEPVKEPTPPPTPPPPPRPKPGPKSRKMAPKEEPKPKPVAPKEDSKPKPVAPTDDPKIPVPLKIPKSKSKLTATPPKVEKPPAKINLTCSVCDVPLKTNAALASHLKSHTPTYTKPHLSCNPCGKWFAASEEAATHHRYHHAATFPYHCRRCFEDYKSLQDYDSHIANGLCMPYDQIPDVKCPRCWRTFITQTLLDGHKCQGYDGRPGGNCSKCSKSYATLRSLKAHQRKCTFKNKSNGGLIADPDVLRRLKPMQVRIARCDRLLARRPGGPHDVSRVRPNYSLDKSYHYPYMAKPAKPEPLRSDSMAAVHGPIREPERDSYTHWDSDDSDSDSVIKKVDSLSTMCLKKLFSKNMIGKVPRKRKKIKNDAFDCDDFNISSDINNIISSLNDDLRNDGVRKNRKDSLIAIAINDIIGVPTSYAMGNETVARSSNSVHTDDKNDNDSNLDDKNEDLNDNVKDLNDVQIENEGTDTVSASDISTELNLIETEDQNTRNDAASESMGDDVDTNDLKTKNDEDSKNNDKNVNLNNDEIRNFKSVDGQSHDDNLKECTDSVVENNHSNTESNYENTDLNNSDMEIEHFDSHSKSDNLNENNDLEIQNSNNDNLNNDSEIIDDLEVKNDDVNHDLGTQNTNDENENPNDSEMPDDNLDSESNCNNDEDSQNDKNDDVRLNETDTQNDNLSISNLDKTSHCGTDMSITQNESDKTIDENSENIDTENNENFVLQGPSLNNEQNSTVNGIHENNTNPTSYLEQNDKLDETKKLSKESPIKHSIENLISNTDKSPDKYIDEVISSIEDIIKKNPRNDEESVKDNFTNGENSNQMDDQMLMDAIDNHIGEAKDKIEDKITLDDLLPKDNKSMELDDISDDDFNFDA